MASLLRVMYSEEEINQKIKELGTQIREYYGVSPVTLICILKGAANFAVELDKNIAGNTTIEYMRASSYKDGQESGNVEILHDIALPVRGKKILIVEDILDTGKTFSKVLDRIQRQDPMEIKIAALLDKSERRLPEHKEINADYLGFEIPDKFVVGFGIDYADRFRNLPFISEYLKEEYDELVLKNTPSAHEKGLALTKGTVVKVDY